MSKFSDVIHVVRLTCKFRYAQRMRDMKTKSRVNKTRTRAYEPDDQPAQNRDSWPTKFPPVATALAMRWVKSARESMQGRFKARTESLREELSQCLSKMREEDDWYFGSETRLEGQDLNTTVSDLLNDRSTKDADMACTYYITACIFEVVA